MALEESSVRQGRRQDHKGLTTPGQVQPWEDGLHSAGVGGGGPLRSEREDEVGEGSQRSRRVKDGQIQMDNRLF